MSEYKSLYDTLLQDPSISILDHPDVAKSYNYFYYIVNKWTFSEIHQLFRTHPSLMFGIIGNVFLPTDTLNDLLSVFTLRLFRKDEELFVNFISHRSLSSEQWDQIESRIPQYSKYRIMFI